MLKDVSPTELSAWRALEEWKEAERQGVMLRELRGALADRRFRKSVLASSKDMRDFVRAVGEAITSKVGKTRPKDPLVRLCQVLHQRAQLNVPQIAELLDAIGVERLDEETSWERIRKRVNADAGSG